MGQTLQINATVLDQDNNPLTGAIVVWSSNNPAVASVGSSGLVTAVSGGTVLIEARSNGQSASAAVTVMQSESRIEIVPPSAMLSSVGETLQQTARVRDGNVHPIVDAAVNWSSDDTGVATVSMQGLVTAVMSGIAEITGESGTVSARIDVVVDIPDTDRDILVEFYTTMGGPDWLNSSIWLSDAPLEEWYGVTDDADGQVTELRLRRNNLRGPIPRELANLENLRVLDINTNRLTGTIPRELGDLSNLIDFNLGANNLSGTIPSSLGNLQNVINFKLDRNLLTGPIPSTLGNLTSGTDFDLCVNQPSGPIPSELGNLSSVGFLCLGANRFTGSLPSALGELSTVWYFHVGQNMLSGRIPLWFGNLSNLQELLLFSNRFTGAFPRTLADLPALIRLSISGNRLIGCIPHRYAICPETT
ncbi:MAG: Ig-like domain-containing protein [Gemmatimonadota bacterium]|nr:Ig-like domain-containing protein [Gemmatimonadota bacterium]